MVDQYDDGREASGKNRLNLLNIMKIPRRKTAVALREGGGAGAPPVITAAGRGEIAEQILRLAEENGVRIREDGPLAEMLAKIEIDSPIPSEAFMAVAEILAYVYRASGRADPFAALGEEKT